MHAVPERPKSLANVRAARAAARLSTDSARHLSVDELVDGLHARQPIVVVRAA